MGMTVSGVRTAVAAADGRKKTVRQELTKDRLRRYRAAQKHA